MQKLLCLVGPTAIGKTALALRLAQKLNAEIVSGDSMQIYRELAIGTAKPTTEETRQVRHYLINERSVFEDYSVKQFVSSAMSACHQIVQQTKLPFVVGGTGFYINALIHDLQLGEPNQTDASLSLKWQQFLEKKGKSALWHQLEQADPKASAKISMNNTRRVLRALTVIERTHHKFSEQQIIKPRYDYLIIGLNADREQIYARINARVDLMMAQGLLNEAKFVYEHRFQEHQALQAIGYKEFFPYFEGSSTLPICIAQLKQASRHYAKRQITYFKNKLPVVWFDPLNDNCCEAKIIERIRSWQK